MKTFLEFIDIIRNGKHLFCFGVVWENWKQRGKTLPTAYNGQNNGGTASSAFLFLGFTMQMCSKSEWGSTSNCIDVYAVLQRANDGKLHVFATKHEANTYSEHLIHSHDELSRFRVDPH